jgi:hypothetical protein
LIVKLVTAVGPAAHPDEPEATMTGSSQDAAPDQIQAPHTASTPAEAEAADATKTTAAATAAAEGCQFFMSGKKRLCNWPCKPGQRYCGNHLFYATGDGEARVPCPANPNQ